MIKKLTKINKELYHYKHGERVIGANENMGGDCSGLIGNCSWLSGNCTGLIGGCTGIEGNLDDCEITDEDRIKRINIEDLIK